VSGRKNIYLDYLSTTPVDPRVISVMHESLLTDFGNPSSQHALGFSARAKIENARTQVANLIHADSKEIIFTSGATESINLALKGAALFYQRQGKHIITMSTEHKAVLDTCRYLASLGFEITYLNPEKNGLLDLNKLCEAIRPDTILASIMHVNNETGVIQDIFSIGELLKEKGVWFHVDAAQSVGKINIDLKNFPIDLLSFTAHKIYGPKGIGALYVRRYPRVQLIPQMHGGEQENKMRSGTLATHQIVGFGEACDIAKNNVTEEAVRIKKLRDQFEKNILQLDGVTINGDIKNRLYNCSNFSIANIDAQLFLKNLSNIELTPKDEMRGADERAIGVDTLVNEGCERIRNEADRFSRKFSIAISQGSACNAVDPEPSPVLIAMGLTRDQANRSFRVSVGRFTTDAEIEMVSQQVVSEIKQPRAK